MRSTGESPRPSLPITALVLWSLPGLTGPAHARNDMRSGVVAVHSELRHLER